MMRNFLFLFRSFSRSHTIILNNQQQYKDLTNESFTQLEIACCKVILEFDEIDYYMGD